MTMKISPFLANVQHIQAIQRRGSLSYRLGKWRPQSLTSIATSWSHWCYYPSVQCLSFASEARAIVGWSAPLGCARALLQRPSPLFSVIILLCSARASPQRPEPLLADLHAPLGCARASLQRPSPLFSHLRTWCVLQSSTSVHIYCSLSIVPFLIVSCLVVSSACVCVCLETPYCPCSVYNLQVGRTNTLVSFPHLQVSSLVSPHWI